MRFRDDILRGLRLGVILLAALLIGLAAYRILREPAVPDVQPVQREVRPAPATPPPLANTQPAVVPPPPPVRRHPSKRTLAEKTVLAESGAKPDTDATCANAAEAAVDQEKEGPDAAAEKAEAAAPDPAIGVESPQIHGSRGRRWLKAIGHFLHIGSKKDLPSQAVRQP